MCTDCLFLIGTARGAKVNALQAQEVLLWIEGPKAALLTQPSPSSVPGAAPVLTASVWGETQPGVGRGHSHGRVRFTGVPR